MKTLCSLVLLATVACDGQPNQHSVLTGTYDVTIVTLSGSIFNVDSTTKGTLNLIDDGTYSSGSWTWGQTTWSDQQTATDGRHGIVYSIAQDERGCVRLELRTAAYPGFMTSEVWLGSVTKDGLDFHSEGTCQEGVEGFSMGGLAQAWAVRR